MGAGQQRQSARLRPCKKLNGSSSTDAAKDGLVPIETGDVVAGFGVVVVVVDDDEDAEGEDEEEDEEDEAEEDEEEWD